MQVVKVFVCSRLTGNADCYFAVASANVDIVLDSAALHQYEEHGHEDTPAFREEIRASLIETDIP